jgi:hypothetical protein
VYIDSMIPESIPSFWNRFQIPIPTPPLGGSENGKVESVTQAVFQLAAHSVHDHTTGVVFGQCV